MNFITFHFLYSLLFFLVFWVVFLFFWKCLAHNNLFLLQNLTITDVLWSPLFSGRPSYPHSFTPSPNSNKTNSSCLWTILKSFTPPVIPAPLSFNLLPSGLHATCQNTTVVQIITQPLKPFSFSTLISADVSLCSALSPLFLHCTCTCTCTYVSACVGIYICI